MSFELPHVISWSHRFAQEVLSAGDVAVDLTAGKGRDTLMLYRCVAPTGQVLGFDIQKQALSECVCLLQSESVPVICRALHVDTPEPGVELIHDDHAHLSSYLRQTPKVIMANLGYFPGGDHTLTTTPEGTCAAFEQALAALAPGGRLVCVLYTAHPGGDEEAAAVETLVAGLSSRDWFVLRLQVANREQAPYLLVAEKRR